MTQPRIGINFIGAKGGVATTAILGLTLLQDGVMSRNGLVSELPPFQRIVPDWGSVVVAGHDIRRGLLFEEALWLSTKDHIVRPELLEQCREEFNAIDGRIRPGTIFNVGPTIASLADMDLPKDETPRQIIERLQTDFDQFFRAEQLEHLIVVNVAPTEPPLSASLPLTWADMDRLLDDPHYPLPASTLYAIAALVDAQAWCEAMRAIIASAHRSRPSCRKQVPGLTKNPCWKGASDDYTDSILCKECKEYRPRIGDDCQ